MPAYTPATLVSVLTVCNLNNKAFYSLASSERITRKVQAAASLAVRYQITGTPTFIVNNNQVFEGENAIQEIAALY
jgi:2-hydroxychromene-2-carboxylate isomerase